VRKFSGGLGPHLFPGWEDSTDSISFEMPGQMFPCQPPWGTSGKDGGGFEPPNFASQSLDPSVSTKGETVVATLPSIFLSYHKLGGGVKRRGVSEEKIRPPRLREQSGIAPMFSRGGGVIMPHSRLSATVPNQSIINKAVVQEDRIVIEDAMDQSTM